MQIHLKYITQIYLIVFGIFLSTCSAKHIEPNKVPPIAKENKEKLDVLDIIYRIAAEKNMRVISDLNVNGGDVYKNFTVEAAESQYKSFVKKYHDRYGKYKSFWGWYLNNELNPLKENETTMSTFWRKIWKSAVTACKNVAPASKVTISPFFLLDKESYRGFEYLQPITYEKWWSKTLSETGIDILMIQDSGAEHLGFYTIADRRPFLQAFKNACDQSGSELWINVETGEVDAKNWEEAIQMEKSNTQKWVYTKTEWLAEKLDLATEFGNEIISWGYYPYMNPIATAGPYLVDNTPEETLKANYNSYKAFYNRIKDNPIKDGTLTKPLINGSLWWIPVNYENFTSEDLERMVKQQIQNQQDLGFDVIWIVNTPANMDFAINREKQ